MALFKIDCHQGKMLCDKNQYKEASFWEKVKLNLYLIACSECRAYSAKNNKLTKVVNKKEVQTIGLSEKEELQKLLNEQMKSNSN